MKAKATVSVDLDYRTHKKSKLNYIQKVLLRSNPDLSQLPRFLPQHHHVGVDEPESIYDHFSFDALNRVNNDSNGAI